MKKILICGATGFLGRNLVIGLDGSYNVSYFSHKDVDLTDKKDVRFLLYKVQPDIIIQAAAVTSGAKDITERPYIHVTDNAVMNSLLFREAYNLKVPHFIFLSCTAMYPQDRDYPLKEEDFNYKIYEKYFGVGWTKVYLEKMCEFYSRLGRTKFTVIRHSNCYGPHDKFDLERSHVFGATVTKIMQAKDKIEVWGDGTEERDFLYVSDLVDFIKLAIEKQETPFELVNVGSGQSITVNDLINRIACLAGKADLRVEYDLSKSMIPSKLVLNCDKAKKIFGWEPKVSLEEGIKKTISWWKENHGKSI